MGLSGVRAKSFLYSLFTHACVAPPDSTTIIKAVDDTMVVGLITDDNETAYRMEVSDLVVRCQDNDLSFNVRKTKELIVDNRKRRAEHTSIHIDRPVVEQVESFKFVSVHITKELSWSTYTNTTTPLPPQELRRLKRFGIGPQILKRFYSCTIEGILTGCITA